MHRLRKGAPSMDDNIFLERYGPWAVIAGASEGTGASFARRLARYGVNLVLVARRAGPLQDLADDIRVNYDVECVTACIDLGKENAPERLLDVAGDREIGLFIFNAGADPNGEMFLDAALDDWNSLAVRNVMTVMRSTYYFSGPMRDRGRGGVILVGSAACYSGVPGISVYAATKAFNLVLGEALWAEMQPHGVDVLNLVLMHTDTPAHRKLMASRGMALPDDLASPDEVAATGLERLPHGPIVNWGLDDEETGYTGIGTSARARKERVLALTESVSAYVRKG
ncbi:SDR family NAD(P)-dependent oxidoreductase [Rhodococcus aetherivorans]